MKSQIARIAVAVLAAFVSLPMMASAQTTVLYVSMKVPFAFSYGAQHMPAGRYFVTLTDDGLLTLSSPPATAMAVAHVSYEPGQNASSQAVFSRYGNQFFLEQLTIGDSGAEINIPESARERMYAAEWATNRQAPARTTLALLGEPSSR